MVHFFVGLFLLLVLLFFWSVTFWRVVLWFVGMSAWVALFGYALSVMFNDSSATPFVWGAILGIPLWCIGSLFYSTFEFGEESRDSQWEPHYPCYRR